MGKFNQSKYIQEFVKEKYDRCIFNVPKGQKAEIEKHWKAKGYKSLNAYVNELIRKDMQGEATEVYNIVIVGRDNKGIINM